MKLFDGLFKRRPSGLLVPDQKAYLKGVYKMEHYRKGELIHECEFENIIVSEGLIFLLNVVFTNQSNVGGWYVGVFTNNYTPVISDTAATITGNAGEFTGYSGGARPTFNAAPAAQPTPSLNNLSNKASFTFTGSATLIGAFIVSTATPGGTTGTLYSAAQFPTSRPVAPTDVMNLGYTLSLASS